MRKRGIYGTRIEDITERADVGKGVFYNYFPSKEALVAALVTAGIDVLERDYVAILKHDLTLAERVEGLARLQERFFDEHPEFALVFHQARGLLLLGGEETTALRDAFADYLSRLTFHLRDAEGRGSQHDFMDAAALIAGAGTGYRSFCEAVGRPVVPSTLATALVAGIPALFEKGTPRRKGRSVPRKRSRKRA
jgi:AcrR family transcriptional regulator